MIVHKIHDLSNKKANELLYSGLSEINDENIVENYHPNFYENSANLFFLLKNGRYAIGKGAYYIIESSGKYIGSAGWNEYDVNTSIAFALTRMYISKEHRGNYLVSEYILKKTLQETISYQRVLLTMNEYNKSLYMWFIRSNDKKRTALFNDWPDIYKKFKPKGKQIIYGIEQYVVELERYKMTDQEKIKFIEQAIEDIMKKTPLLPVRPELELSDLGLDSLDTVELQMYYEEKTGNTISVEATISTVKDLMELME
jgi:acyl carrier protein